MKLPSRFVVLKGVSLTAFRRFWLLSLMAAALVVGIVGVGISLRIHDFEGLRSWLAIVIASVSAIYSWSVAYRQRQLFESSDVSLIIDRLRDLPNQTEITQWKIIVKSVGPSLFYLGEYTIDNLKKPNAMHPYNHGIIPSDGKLLEVLDETDKDTNVILEIRDHYGQKRIKIYRLIFNKGKEPPWEPIEMR